MKQAIVIIGLGNILMSDEGIGVRVAQKLQTCEGVLQDVEVIEAGTAGMGILHAIAGRQKVVFVDCAMMKEEPGMMRRFTPGDVISNKSLPGRSLHEGDLLDILELSRQLGDCPFEVVIYGIEPRSTAPGEELSPQLASRLADYVETVLAEIRNASGG
ncbi:MAG: hydrogenase maturation protease [Sedimentisphaerales bacterium]|nr:hydrogenase maturation protease [Sedimentisphaerales bacterium]